MSRYVDENARIADDIHNAYEEGYADGKRDAVVHGHLEKEFDGNNWTACSECGCRFIETVWFNPRAYDFCPYCGALMDEVTE